MFLGSYLSLAITARAPMFLGSYRDCPLMVAHVKASTEAQTVRAKPALVRARTCCRPIASAWLVTVRVAVRRVRTASAFGRRVGDHGVLMDRHEADAGVVPDARVVGSAVEGAGLVQAQEL